MSPINASAETLRQVGEPFTRVFNYFMCVRTQYKRQYERLHAHQGGLQKVYLDRIAWLNMVCDWVTDHREALVVHKTNEVLNKRQSPARKASTELAQLTIQISTTVFNCTSHRARRSQRALSRLLIADMIDLLLWAYPTWKPENVTTTNRETMRLYQVVLVPPEVERLLREHCRWVVSMFAEKRLVVRVHTAEESQRLFGNLTQETGDNQKHNCLTLNLAFDRVWCLVSDYLLNPAVFHDIQQSWEKL